MHNSACLRLCCFIYGACYSEVLLFCSMWANGVAKCKSERSPWRVCGGLCREEKASLCFRCNPKLGIEFQLLFWEKTLYLCENNLGVLGFGRLGIVRVSLQHLLCFLYLLVKIYSAITHRCGLKVKPHKSLVFFLVGAYVYFLVKFSSFLACIWWGLLRFIILLKSILRRSTIWRHFGRQFGNKASAIYNTTNYFLSVFINGLWMVSLKSLNSY